MVITTVVNAVKLEVPVTIALARSQPRLVTAVGSLLPYFKSKRVMHQSLKHLALLL